MLSGKGKRRRDVPLDDIVEESIVRHFDLDIAEDDFASAGPLKDVASSMDGVKSDYEEFVQMSAELAEHLLRHDPEFLILHSCGMFLYLGLDYI